MSNVDDNNLLSGLGFYIRPLLSEAGTAMEMGDAGFVGVCFANPKRTDSKVFFAEFVNKNNRTGKYIGDYILPSSCAFVRAVESAANDKRPYLYSVTSDDPAAVREPLAKEFPSADRPHAISSYPLGDEAGTPVLYFIAEDVETFRAFSERFEIARELFVKTVRDAFFLAAAADRELAWWSHSLMSQLQDFFPSYTGAQQRALAKVRHPYLQWQEDRTEIPVVSGDIKLPSDKEFLEAIHGAATVEVTGLLSGSFQAHNVYSAKIRPSGGGKEFEAVIKAARQGQADKEINGYFHLLPYFRDIRSMMPSAPLVFPTGKTTKPTAIAHVPEDIYAVVTPHLGGVSLYEFVKNNWRDSADRVAVLTDIFGKLTEFLKSIRPITGKEEMVSPYRRIYESHLGKAERQPGKRLEKTIAQLTKRLPNGADTAPFLEDFNEIFRNPLWVLQSAPLDGNDRELAEFWQTMLLQRRKVVYGHGDFHVANVLFDKMENRVTVLDFDYVGEHPEHEDQATLEVSFVLAIAACPYFQDREQWQRVWPNAIKFLSGRIPFGAIEHDRLAFDLAQVVARIRSQSVPSRESTYMPDSHHYHACLATALLRLFTSHSQKMDIAHFRPVGAAALFWLGLLLNDFVRKDHAAPAMKIGLFELR